MELRKKFNIFVNFSITLVSLAICIIPFQRHIVPNKLIAKFIASDVLSNIDVFNCSKFPENIAKVNDIIIKIGQTIFNTLYHLNNFIQKLLFLVLFN